MDVPLSSVAGNGADVTQPVEVTGIRGVTTAVGRNVVSLDGYRDRRREEITAALSLVYGPDDRLDCVEQVEDPLGRVNELCRKYALDFVIQKSSLQSCVAQADHVEVLAHSFRVNDNALRSSPFSLTRLQKDREYFLSLGEPGTELFYNNLRELDELVLLLRVCAQVIKETGKALR